MTEDIFELSITRHIANTPERVWKTMTERLPDWWCPAPWSVEINAIEWRSGGRFDTTMYGPDGEVVPNHGVFLEVAPGQRMVFTDAVDGNWNPRGPFMIGILEVEPEGEGTRYTGRARHWTKEAMEQHVQMGFAEGWRAVADQLAALAESASV